MAIPSFISRRIASAKMNYRIGQEAGAKYGFFKGVRVALKKILIEQSMGHLQACLDLIKQGEHMYACARLSMASTSLRLIGMSESAQMADMCMSRLLRGGVSSAQYMITQLSSKISMKQ